MTPPLHVRLPVVVVLAVLAACDEPTRPETVASIRVTPDPAYVRIETTLALSAAAVTARGRVRTDVELSWTSSDTAIVAVSPGGQVTAKRFGAATVTATAGGVSGSALVHVTGTPGIRIVSGAGVEDTITGIPPAPLVVEMRNARGVAVAGERIVFAGVVSPGEGDPGVLVQVAPPFEYVRFAAATTDASGRAAARVRMGFRAGVGMVEVHHWSSGWVDTARYTIRAGAPARVRLQPSDTAVFSGAAVDLRASVADRGGNPLPASVSYTADPGPARVDEASGRVTTTGFGNARVIGRAGEVADTVRIAAVPEGAIVVASPHEGLEVLNLDGTARRTIDDSGLNATWTPDGGALVYQSSGYGGVLLTRTLTGAASPLVREPNGGYHHWPQFSRDGAWLYFFTTVPGQPQTIWRVRAEGTGLERISGGSEYLEGRPSPSPDGERITYFVGGGYETHVRVRSLATGEESGNLARGHMPAWSPAGDLIVFNELRGDRPAGLLVIRPDGTGLRRITPEGFNVGWAPTWSPDGRWVLVNGHPGIHLIEVESGLLVTVPLDVQVLSVEWRPGGVLP